MAVGRMLVGVGVLTNISVGKGVLVGPVVAVGAKVAVGADVEVGVAVSVAVTPVGVRVAVGVAVGVGVGVGVSSASRVEPKSVVQYHLLPESARAIPIACMRVSSICFLCKYPHVPDESGSHSFLKPSNMDCAVSTVVYPTFSAIGEPEYPKDGIRVSIFRP